METKVTVPGFIPEPDRDLDTKIFERIVEEGDSFTNLVEPRLRRRDLARCDVRLIIEMGLERVGGRLSELPRLFNVRDHKKFWTLLKRYELLPDIPNPA